MATLKYWDAVAATWKPLPIGSAPEVHVGPNVLGYSELLWVDTDEVAPRTQLDAFELVGPWTSAAWATRLLPWRADVLVVWSATCFTTLLGVNGCALAVDGSARSHAQYYFNQTSSHKEVAATVVLRNMAAGNHTWGIYNEFSATSDAGDRAHISLVAEPI